MKQLKVGKNNMEFEHQCGCVKDMKKGAVIFIKKCQIHKEKSGYVAIQHPGGIK